MKIYEANLDGSEPEVPDARRQGLHRRGELLRRRQADRLQRPGTPGNVQLYIMNADGTSARQLTNGPELLQRRAVLLARTATKVIFRSDRKEKDRLQLYVINADGTGEKALTDNDKWVYWAPYWYKDGKHIIYTAADHSDPNGPAELRPVLDEHRDGQDDAADVRPGAGRAAGVQPGRQEGDVDVAAATAARRRSSTSPTSRRRRSRSVEGRPAAG